MSDSSLRLIVFLALLTAFGTAEACWPRNQAEPHRRRRWPVNFGLTILNTLCLRILMPWLAIDAAIWAQAHDAGLLHVIAVPPVAATAISILALDLVIYTQHVLMHRIPVLWRLHRAHHTDVALDVSSGARFHPIEILLSMGIKIGAVLLIGAPPGAVLAFEILLSSFALFTHANIALPVRLDKLLRWVFVTPDMHRIHHSVLRAEHDRNFGFHVSWWDRLFATYLAMPTSAQTTMAIGLDRFRKPEEQRLSALLREPLATL